MTRSSAYLIVICDEETNGILSATIWSSPEWEQSMCLQGCRTYVAYEIRGTTFDDARKRMIEAIQNSRSRYHYLNDFIVPDEMN